MTTYKQNSEKIVYNLLDGEPVANSDCFYHRAEKCTLISQGTYLEPCIPSCHSVCIPGLRMQRDYFKKIIENFAEWDEKKEIAKHAVFASCRDVREFYDYLEQTTHNTFKSFRKARADSLKRAQTRIIG